MERLILGNWNRARFRIGSGRPHPLASRLAPTARPPQQEARPRDAIRQGIGEGLGRWRGHHGARKPQKKTGSSREQLLGPARRSVDPRRRDRASGPAHANIQENQASPEAAAGEPGG